MFDGPRDAQVPGLSGLRARQGLAEKQESACLPSILVAALAEGHCPQPQVQVSTIPGKPPLKILS